MKNLANFNMRGFIGLFKAKIGGEWHHYVYVPHASEPYGFATDYPKPFDWDDFVLKNSAYGLWETRGELVENFQKYAEAKGLECQLTAIMPVESSVHLKVYAAVINPQYDTIVKKGDEE